MAARCLNITELNYSNGWCVVGEAMYDWGTCPVSLAMGRTVALPGAVRQGQQLLLDS